MKETNFLSPAIGIALIFFLDNLTDFAVQFYLVKHYPETSKLVIAPNLEYYSYSSDKF